MSLTNGMTGGSIFKDKAQKPTETTSNDSTDKFSATFRKKQTSALPTEQIPLPTEAPPEILPLTPTEAPKQTLPQGNVELIMAELMKLQRMKIELMKKQEQLPQEIELQIKQNLKALSAEAAQSFDNYLKAITAQRIADAGRSLERLNELEEIRKKQLLFSSRLKKICVGLLISNAVLLTAIFIILILK